MRTLFLAPLLLTTAITLLACSDSVKTTSGGSGTGGSAGAGSSSSGTGGTGGGSPTATSAGGGCTDDNSCAALFACGCCIDLLCAPECETLHAACTADSDCNVYADCAAFCFDQACMDGCAAATPAGVDKAKAYLSCIYCSASCQSACTDNRTWSGVTCP
jgi:hypothetical protein